VTARVEIEGVGGVRALVYHGPGDKRFEAVPDPALREDGDAIVRIDTVTICGTDLHILKGDVPEVTPGRILGHEAVGTVVARGSAVHTLREGDRVLLSCVSACGRCRFCREGRPGQCLGGGGWIFGHLIDGVQAEYARVPYADTSTYKIPTGLADEQVLYLSDVVPTAYEVGVQNGRVSPGDIVVVVGAGPIGLLAMRTARLLSPTRVVAVDPAESRRQHALRFGADVAVTPGEAADTVRSLTAGLGADVAVEAVGIPSTFEQCAALVRPGGRVANVGVHGKPATLHLEDLWIKDVTITTGLVDTVTIPTLLALIQAGALAAADLTTHRFGLEDVMEAYDTFARAAETNALKVVMTTA
jgi:alcohol dehydrogenase